MLTLKAVASTPAPRTLEREELAAAISARDQAMRAAEAGSAAVARARELITERDAAVTAATAAVTAGKTHDAKVTAAALGRGAPAPPTAVRVLRQALIAAEDDRDAAVAAAASLAQQQSETEEELASAEVALAAAINGVLASAARPIVDRLNELKVEVPKLQAVTLWIKERGGERRGNAWIEVRDLRAPLADVEGEIMAALQHGFALNVDDALRHPVLSNWEEACEALRDDPDAPLPT